MSKTKYDQCPQCKKHTIDIKSFVGDPKKPKLGDKVIDTCSFCGWKSERTYVGFRGEDLSSWQYKVTGRLSYNQIKRLLEDEGKHKRKRPRGVHKL